MSLFSFVCLFVCFSEVTVLKQNLPLEQFQGKKNRHECEYIEHVLILILVFLFSFILRFILPLHVARKSSVCVIGLR